MAKAKKLGSVGRPDKQERALEAAVFGDTAAFQDRLRRDSADEEEAEDDNIETKRDEAAGLEDNLTGLNDDELFMIDSGPVFQNRVEDASGDEGNKSDSAIKVDPELASSAWKAAWHDSDDETLKVSLATEGRLRKLRRTEDEDLVSGKEYARRLRAQFDKVYPVPDWALPPTARANHEGIKHHNKNEDDSDADSEGSEMSMDGVAVASSADPLAALFRSSKGYTKNSRQSTIRPPGRLPIIRLKDANHAAPAKSAIQTLSFHPRFPLLMVAGYDQTIRLFHIDGKINTPATSLHLRNVPVQTAEFSKDGEQVFAGGRRKYYHAWELESGAVQKRSDFTGHEGPFSQRNAEHFSVSLDGSLIAIIAHGGWTNFVSTVTGQWLHGVKIDRQVAHTAWHVRDGLISIANTGGEIWEYSTLTRSVVRKWQDDGGFATTKIAIGDGDRFMAVGSKSGIVNIYDRQHPSFTETDAPKPKRTLEQLTTSIHVLQFSPDGQILVLASRAKKDAMKVIHLPSCTVFQNWPTQKTPLGRIGAVAFSPGTEMMAIGNEQGRVTLWNIAL